MNSTHLKPQKPDGLNQILVSNSAMRCMRTLTFAAQSIPTFQSMKLFPFLPYVTVSLIGVYFAYQKGQTVVYEENAKIYAVGIQSARERSDMPRDYLNFLLARYYYSANRASFESQDIQQKVDASALREVPIGKGTAALDEQQAFFRRNGIP